MINPFVFACITPHGLPILEELSQGNPQLMARTRSGMKQLGTWMREADPETIVVLTPHGLKIDGMFSVTDSSYLSGEMSEQTVAGMVGDRREDKGVTVEFNRAVDRDLAKRIVAAADKAALPVAAANFATAEGPFSTLPLDWGVMVPLYFMPDVPIVVVTPSRRISYEDHIRFGAILGEQVRQSGKRVGLIASCDWSHAHDVNGPYGYHEDAVELDRRVVASLKEDEIEKVMEFAAPMIDHAKPDGIWQALILAGAIPREARNSTFLSYEVPTYFGMMTVAYHAQ
ncbi:extradiol ring-cleavage dioxygenase [Alicyclobacillus fastidiosus]|uniref:Extradiol ring-cleavage dioxygenase n=1 Tax=Alicyclobacillus fastidiosus TaxID=392011 RepID=A0ABY6ZED6_9BACL|nr:extradiol ring-cleavage dioxygenase [Alicyclobacillus fastidiosus]WAH41095.1 extradiol ring-cleavage dioxygenase [Alicyclobacillus fastidiosus]GMA62651.1 extradiol dioxygenase [Alicyclobacillus fastidiosus]